MKPLALVLAFGLALLPGLAHAAEAWARVSALRNQLYAYRLDTVSAASHGAGEVTVAHYDPIGFDYQGRQVHFTVARRRIDCADWTYQISTATLFDGRGQLLVELRLNLPPQTGHILLADKALHDLVCEGEKPSTLATTGDLAAALAELKAAYRP